MNREYFTEKVDAYQIAIQALLYHESDSDNRYSARLRDRLAKKLQREIDHWCDENQTLLNE